MRALQGALALVLSATFMTACAPRPKKPTTATSVPVANASGKAPVIASPCDESVGTPLDAEHAEGATISDVCVKGGSQGTNAKVRSVLLLGAGKTLTATALRRDLEEAYGTGLLRDIEASARTTGSSAVLVVTLKESPRVTGIAFEGVTPARVESAEFPKAGAVYRQAVFKRAMERLKDDFVGDGWEDVKIDHKVETSEENGIRIKVTAVEGSRSTAGKVSFSGVFGGRDTALRKAIELPEGTPLSDDRLGRASLLATAFYYDNGFLTAKVESSRKPRGADGVTPITLTVTEGKQFRVGSIRVKGVDAATAKDILAGLSLKPGAICRRSELVADLEKVRKRTDGNGQPLKAEPETDLVPATSIVNLTIAIAP